MKKINSAGEKKLQEVESKNQSIQHPKPLEFQSKKLTLLCATDKEKENKIVHSKQHKDTKKKVPNQAINYPKPQQKQNHHQKQKFSIEANDQDQSDNCIHSDSDSSGSSVTKLLPNKVHNIHQIKQRRKKQHDRTPFYDQIIYKDPRMRRINFVWSSSGSSDSEYETVRIIKQAIPEKKIIDCSCRCQCKCQQQKEKSEDIKIPSPEHLLDVKILPMPIQKIQEPPQVIKQENKQHQKQPTVNKYIQKPPVEEWAKYETPDVQHPQQLKVPEKPPEKQESTKPLYGKPRERVEFKIPKSEVVQQNFVPKALPVSKVQPGKKLGESKSNSVSSNSDNSDFCCCECQCD